jgi:hypothetical protein
MLDKSRLTQEQILQDEPSILEALNTPDGFAIYQDILKPTNPDLWQKLADQHRMSQPTQSPTDKLRGSSKDQARHVAGKLARLMLATPSDPDLKTHSSRRPSTAQHAQANTSMPLAFMDWMDPMSAAASTGTTNNDAWRTQRKNNKSKEKETEKQTVMRHEAIDTQDFSPCPPGRSRLTGTTITTNNNDNINDKWYISAEPVPRTDTERPDAPVRHNSHATTTASDQSMWPEGDSLGNWQDVKRPVDPRLRGGAEKAEKLKLRRKKSMPWRSVVYGDAMHFHG